MSETTLAHDHPPLPNAVKERSPRIHRLALAIAYLVPGLLLFQFVYRHGLDGQALLAYADQARDFAKVHPVSALVLFFACYLVTVIYSLPTTVALNLLAGYLFGAITGALTACLACTLGAFLLCRLYRGLFADCRFIRNRNPLPQRPFWYIVLLRLSPVFPAPLINAAAGIYRVRQPTFLGATFAGSLPLIYAYASLGGGLDQMHSIGDLFSPQLIALFSLMTVLTLVAMLNPATERIRRVASSDLRHADHAEAA